MQKAKLEKQGKYANVGKANVKIHHCFRVCLVVNVTSLKAGIETLFIKWIPSI